MTPHRKHTPDFVEALARGLDVIKAFTPEKMELTVSDVAIKTSLARPTARRLLITLEQLGYVRSFGARYLLTPKTLELGTSYVSAQGMWDVARPHLVSLVDKTGESSSMSQLDGSDIVYTARVPVPKIIALSVHVGTRFPAAATSMGKVLLADLPADELARVLRIPSNSRFVPRITPSGKAIRAILLEVSKRGWALSDEQLSLGIRSIAAPVRCGSGRTIAAVNVSVNAAETSIALLKKKYLPLLLDAAAAITADFALLATLPTTEPLTS